MNESFFNAPLFNGSFSALLLALILDHLLGEVKHLHPLVGFGWLTQRCEQHFNSGSTAARFMKGVAAWSLLTLPLFWVLLMSRPEGVMQIVFDAVLVYFCLGFRSLREHTTPIAEALQALEKAEPQMADTHRQIARERTAGIVSRDTDTLDETQCARAAMESLLENGNDALFATLFWYLLLGPAGAVMHRSVNTLDASWGYRTPRYEWFGKFAARADDIMAWLPARLTALSYSFAGNPVRGLRCWRLQAHLLASPNGGPCMSAGAGSLGVILGGPCRYHGRWVAKPFFGEGCAPAALDILRAQQLLTRALAGWLGVIGACYLMFT